jgi:hypothetical protein
LRLSGAGAGLGFFAVVLAVVVPAEQLQVVEVGGAAVFPVVDVVGFAPVGGLGAAIGLAVLIAYDERFPDCWADGAGRAADVEDLGCAGHEDAGDVAVAQESFEGGVGEAAVLVAFQAGAGDGVSVYAGSFVEVDDLGDVGPHGAGGADRSAFEGLTEQVRDRVGLALAEKSGVVGSVVAFEFGCDRGFVDQGGFGVVEAVYVEHAVEAAGGVVTPPGEQCVVVGGAAVAVDRVGHVLDRGCEFVWGAFGGEVDEDRFDVGDLRGPSGV